MKVLVTGAAGFIGNEVCLHLVGRGDEVFGIDQINDYYAPLLKFDRLERLGFGGALAAGSTAMDSKVYKGLAFQRIDIGDSAAMRHLFAEQRFDAVVHLAAQAGVRYSLENPQAYIDSNITGFLNILECCRAFPVRHLVYASSSSVYGQNQKTPFRTTDAVDHPVSLYAATKRSNELMAHTYSHLFGIPTTGLRFFTVYGPWGRPDMAPMLFAKAILAGKPIAVFNHGDMKRDFTFVDDIVEGTLRALDKPPAQNQSPEASDSKWAPWRLFNIGRGEPVQLLEFIQLLESSLGREAIKDLRPMQPGDVPVTWADTLALEKQTGYKPKISLKEGVRRFADWYLHYANREKI